MPWVCRSLFVVEAKHLAAEGRIVEFPRPALTVAMDSEVPPGHLQFVEVDPTGPVATN